MTLSRFHYGHVLGAAAMLAPVLGLFAPLMVAPLAVVVIVAAIVVDLRRKPRTPLLPNGLAGLDWPFLAPYLGLFAWAAISLFWSVDGAGAITKWASLAVAGLPCAYPRAQKNWRHIVPP